MRDPNRIPIILDQIENLWKQYPDLRLAQLIINVAHYATEDDDLIKLIKEQFKNVATNRNST